MFRTCAPSSGPARWRPAAVTPQMIALGDSVCHGLVAVGTCQGCHAPGAQGSALPPDLTDAEWLHSDGSLARIFNTVTSGVLAPTQFSSVMPPNGGAPLSPAQALAVSAYIHSPGRARGS